MADPIFEGSRRRPAMFQRLSEIVSGYHGGRWLGTMRPRYGCANVGDRLRDIRVPTLVIVGELDTPGVHEIADAYVAGIAGAQKMVIPSAGHMRNMDELERFNEVVLQFLARVQVGP